MGCQGLRRKILPSAAADVIARSEETRNPPPGWDEARTHELIAHHENEAEDERFAEIESAWKDPGVTMVAVRTEFVPKVHSPLARSERPSQLNVTSGLMPPPARRERSQAG